MGGDERLQLGPTLLEAQRQEAQEDDGQHVALVVGGLDGAAKLDGGLPQLIGDVDEAAARLARGFVLLLPSSHVIASRLKSEET